jgi:nucleotide-binding universal stress UspA family protein
MFKRILVPLDGSTRAERALPVAARVARATGGSLLLVQVINPPIDYSGGLGLVPMMTEQAIEMEMAGATDYLKAVAASPRLAEIETRTEVSFGLPAQYLIAAAEADESDLVVLCSHGRTGFTRWALGSVAHRIIHHSTVPVLVLHAGEPLPPVPRADATHLLSALVALDGSPLAETALAPAAHLVAALAAPERGTLHLMQVVKIFPTTAEEGFVSQLNEEALKRAEVYLASVKERLQETFRDLNLSITWSVALDADVADAILGTAEHGEQMEGAEGFSGCDLIAMSTHGRGGLERWVMGSVTERVLTTTKLPMLIVRPEKKS